MTLVLVLAAHAFAGCEGAGVPDAGADTDLYPIDPLCVFDSDSDAGPDGGATEQDQACCDSLALSPQFQGYECSCVDGIAILHTYGEQTTLFRGELHVHTENSDAFGTPSELVLAYKEHGYDFVALADHDFVNDDPGIDDITYLFGDEETVAGPNDDRHLLRLGTSVFSDLPVDDPQTIIDEAQDQGQLVAVAHPNFSHAEGDPYWSDAALLSLEGPNMIEVYNAFVENRWGEGFSEDRLDVLLSDGHQILAIASDDCHHPSGADSHGPYCFTAFSNVFSPTDDPEVLLASIRSGNFYSSAGRYQPMRFSVDGLSISVRSCAHGLVEFVARDGEVVGAQVVPGSNVALPTTYDVVGDEMYVRIRVTSTAGMSWSNPFYVVDTSGMALGE